MSYDSIAKSYLKVLTEQQLSLNFDAPTESRMIRVDGILKHRHNSEGKPIHHTDDGIRNFHRWFGNSTTVDEQGRPKVFYHGTYHDFDEFAENQRGLHFVSTSPKWTSKFIKGSSGNFDEGQNILPVYVKANNPFDYQNKKHVNFLATKASLGNLAIQQIRSGSWSRIEDRTTMNHIKNNFDGVYVKEDGVKNLAVFHPHQIKSALGNSGEFVHPTKITESVEHPMIEVDGEMKHRHNSEGKPIHPSDEGIKNFHRWFGNSHTVDSEGRPKVFYHGTGIDFDEFNTAGGDGKTHNTGAFFTDSPHVASTYSKGGRSHNVIPVYVKLHSPVIVDAKGRNWDSITQSAKTLIPTKSGKLKSSTIRTMFKDSWDYPDDTASTDDIAQWSRRNGHHGVIVKNVVDCGSTAYVNATNKETEPSTVAIAFDKQQIKSALGNNGQFSTTSNKIHEAYLAVTKQHRELSDHPMIEVDGEMKHRHNSEGKPIHHTDEGIRNFHHWFDNSRVTEDRQGSSRIVAEQTPNATTCIISRNTT